MKEVKRYSGYELIKALKNNEISTGTKLYIEYEDKNNSSYRYKFYTKVGEFRQLHIWREEKGKEDKMLERVLDTEDLTNSTFVIYEKEEEYSLSKSVRILSVFLEELETVFEKTKINNTKERKALRKLLDTFNDSIFISKKQLMLMEKEIDKQNEPYEAYNKESRAYWLNLGKKSLINMLLNGLGGE